MKKEIPESIYVLLIPGLAFLVTYCIQLGYCSYYQIPVALIAIDGRNIALIAIVMVLVFAIIIGLEQWLSGFMSEVIEKYENENKRKRQIKNTWLLFLITLGFALFIFPDKNVSTMLFMYLGLVIIIIVDIIYTHITRNRKDKKSVNETNHSVEQRQKPDISITRLIIGESIARIIFVLLVSISISMSYGWYTAKKQNKYYSVNERTDILGLVMYGEYVIAAKIDGEAITKSFEIVKIEHGSKITIKNSIK